MIVVGLVGYARSGKDTVADHLVAEHGFVKMAFADTIKTMLRTLDPIIDGDAGPVRLSHALMDVDGDENELKANYPEYRRLMQALGTECIRAEDPDFWVDATRRRIRGTKAHGVVVTDIRFPNELAAVRHSSGYPATIWRIERPGVGAADGHVSETNVGMMEVDRTIINGGPIAHLQEKIDDILLGQYRQRYMLGRAA